MENLDKIKYQGIALNKNLGRRGRSSGEITFSGRSFSYSDGQNFKNLPLAGLKVELIKTGILLYYFSHQIEPEWVFYTADKNIIKEENINHNPFVIDIKKKLKKRKIIRNFSIFFVLLALVSIVLFGIALKHKLVMYIAKKVPVEWEEQLGEISFEQYSLGGNIISDSPLNDEMNDFASILLSNMDNKQYQYKFYIDINDEVNAFALPGGKVVVTSGLIEVAKSPEEILGVLAHEIAHVEQKHVIRQIINRLQIYTLIGFLFGDISGVGALILDSGSFLITQGYSRDFELEADRVGLSYLVKSNIDPKGMITLFETLEEVQEKKFEELIGDDEEKTVGEKVLEKIGQIEKNLYIISTHPQTKERINILKDKISRLPETRHNNIDFSLGDLRQAIEEFKNEKGE
jgi:Zn-dependent protease with chaperone function